ncbi:unnamed protein product [Dovyalis caffra]|uniref:Uncharacterized protein n=1 Tax=Dovyalis caffra TaxID=77055 RepID=A0AAV1RND6_9ROSI|nr:unnamed protein product [Dovyalis caffra]
MVSTRRGLGIGHEACGCLERKVHLDTVVGVMMNAPGHGVGGRVIMVATSTRSIEVATPMKLGGDKGGIFLDLIIYRKDFVIGELVKRTLHR